MNHSEAEARFKEVMRRMLEKGVADAHREPVPSGREMLGLEAFLYAAEADGWFCGFEREADAKAAAEEAADVWNWRRPVD